MYSCFDYEDEYQCLSKIIQIIRRLHFHFSVFPFSCSSTNHSINLHLQKFLIELIIYKNELLKIDQRTPRNVGMRHRGINTTPLSTSANIHQRWYVVAYSKQLVYTLNNYNHRLLLLIQKLADQ